MDIIKKRRYNYPSILLLSWFFITFIMFSLSKFQLDYYTNILVPFAAIISAVYLHDIYCAYFNHETESSVVSFPRRRESRIYKIYQRMCCNLVVQKVQRSTTNTTLAQHKLLYVQIYLFYLLALVFFALGLYVLSGVAQIVVVIMAIAVLGFSYWAAHKSQWLHAIIVGVVAIQSIFIILMLIYATIYSKYDLGYNVANYINRQQAQLNVVSYKLNSLTLEFYLKNNGYQQIDDMGKLKQLPGKFYVISSVENLAELKNYYGNRLKVLSDFDDMTIDKLSQHILQANKFATLSQQYLLMTIEN